jgi:predicted DNA-binding transcriptional regulator AlpA
MPANELLDTVSAPVLESTGRTDHHRIAAAAEPEHLTLDETAEWLRCSTRTLQRLLETGSGPPVIRISERRLIFRVADLRTWLARRTTGHADLAPRRHRGPASKRPAL